MPNLNDIERKVNDLIEDESLPSEFRSAYTDIEKASLITTNVEIVKLRIILSTFWGKLPNKVVFKPIRARAKDLANELMLRTLEERREQITARNDAFNTLINELNIQINKGNADANRLEKIKGYIDKATATVEAVKQLINELTATNATTKSNLKALISILDDLSSIFKPDET